MHALANFVGVLCGALAGHGPAGPADTPLSWAVMAAATRETFASGATTPAIPITPVFTALHLQEVPVVGPLFVTPVVTIVNDIPVISDLLHPLFGYPATPDGLAAPRDVWVMSADGTEINVHFMPASGLLTGQTAPTVFVGSGLGLPGATNINASPLDGILADFFGLVGVATLRNAGYNVVTWDPRGEYSSGGSIQLDSRDYEARDVSAIINWVAAQPQTQLDGTGDPRMGMVGPSYGGSIQLVTAATDHRVDAIVPTIAWNTLTDALYPNGAFKSGWGTLLEGVLLLTLARVNPRILPAVVYGDLTGKIVPEDEVLMAQRGPGPVDGYPDLVSQITAPTMLIQGTVDTLFSLQEANLTAASLVAQGVPTKMLWFCGGHGLCINNMFDLSDGALIQQRTVEWLDRYVKGEAVSTGPGFEWVDQRGQYFSMPNYGSAVGEPMLAARTGTEVLPLIPFVGGSGPLLFIAPIGGTKALNAVNLETPVSTTTTYIVGEPQLSLSYSGTGTGDHIYAQLADNTAGLVLGNQVTPIPVNLDGQHHTISIPLAPVAQTLRPGETVTLQLFAWSADYPSSSSLGSLTVNDVRLALPTYDVATPDAVTVV